MIMPKEKISGLEKDRLADESNIKAVLNEIKDSRKIAGRISSELTNKYGLEFGGWIRIEHHLLEHSFVLKCANGWSLALEIHELEDLPSKIMFMRKQHLGLKLKGEKEKNEANFAIHSI